MIASSKAKIFIVDDHPILRQGLALLINHEKDMIFSGEASDSTEAMSGIEKVRPDLILMDISLEGTSGIALTKDILAKYPNMRVLIISMYDESVYVDRALQAGAKGYLMKREVTDHITSAIRKVLGGEIYVSERWKERLAQQYAVRKSGGAEAEDFSSQKLSDRQLEVLQLLGQGYSTKKIADTLHISVKTVESHYATIKVKLDLENSNELIQYAVKWCLSEK